MKSPEEKAREIVDKALEKPDENLPIEKFLALFSAHLVKDIAQALTLPQVTEDEIEKAAQEWIDNDMFGYQAFQAGVHWCLKKLKGE